MFTLHATIRPDRSASTAPMLFPSESPPPRAWPFFPRLHDEPTRAKASFISIPSRKNAELQLDMSVGRSSRNGGCSWRIGSLLMRSFALGSTSRLNEVHILATCDPPTSVL